jgi:hypothetical protein
MAGVRRGASHAILYHCQAVKILSRLFRNAATPPAVEGPTTRARQA